MKLRTGRKLDRTIYIQLGASPSDDDELLGLFLDPARAELLVRIANGWSPPLEHHEQCRHCGVTIRPQGPRPDWRAVSGTGRDYPVLYCPASRDGHLPEEAS